tara:strand:+ start:120 stop:248 length:129 start_codon:yes stop_codon:yes gene_type:complete
MAAFLLYLLALQVMGAYYAELYGQNLYQTSFELAYDDILLVA